MSIKMNDNNLCEEFHMVELPYPDFNTPKEVERSEYEVSGTGKIVIRNTGGSSASEGGMGTGGGPEKGAGIPGAEGGDKNGSKEEADETWDPLKPKEDKGKEKS